VFYSGSKLAPDLSLPRLQKRWASTPSPQTAGGTGLRPEAAEVLDAVAAAWAALRTGSENGDGIGAATADLLAALADPTRAGWGERWGTAADRFDRAARAPGGHVSELGPVAGELRVLARRLLGARGRAGRGAVGGVALAVAVAALVGRDRRLAGRARPRPPGRRCPPGQRGRHRARPRPPTRGTAGSGTGTGRGERPGTGQATTARRVGAVPPPAEQRAHHAPTDRDPTDRDLCASVLSADPGAVRFGVVRFGAGLAAAVVGGSVVTDRQEQAVGRRRG
jgi:hypothetical protein